MYVQILCYKYIQVCIHVDLWSSEAAGVCRDTRNALLSPTRLRIPILYLVHLTIYSCLGFFILLLLFFPFFFIYFFYNRLLNYTKGNMMIRQLMFFGRKKFGLPLFFNPRVLYTQPVSQHSFDLRCVIIITNINWPSLV